jgi:hypothetical protein
MGYGCIAVDIRLLATILKAPEGARLEETPHDAIAAVLLLPDTYRVVGIAQDFSRRCYLVGVESDELPATPVGAIPPTLLPTYQQDFHEEPDGSLRSTVSILRLDVFTPPPDPWPVVS